MKSKKLLNLVAIAMTVAVTSGIIPTHRVLATNNTIYSNDFTSSKLPDAEDGNALDKTTVSIATIGDSNKALKFNAQFDGTGNDDSWENNKHEFGFDAKYSGTIEKGSILQFDILIPKEKADYQGIIQYLGCLSNSEWDWSGQGTGNISASDFTEAGNGLVKYTVNIPISEDVDGLNRINLQITSWGCDYSGDMYIDNIKLSPKASSASEEDSTMKKVYRNNFESGKLPDEQSGDGLIASSVSVANLADDNKALKFEAVFNGDTGDTAWDDNKIAFGFNGTYGDTIAKGSQVKFDIIIPTEKADFSGVIKYCSALSDQAWNWVGQSIGEVKASDFVDQGDGFSKATAIMEVPEDVNGLQRLNLQITQWGCDYNGDMYIDNIEVLTAKTEKEEEKEEIGLSWDFSDASKGVDGFYAGGAWEYNGPSTGFISYDSSVGNGALALNLDYSNNASTSWSELKVSNWLNAAADFTGYNKFSFDFIYDPAKMTQGSFKVKLFANDTTGSSSIDATGDISSSDVEYLDNGLVKAKAVVMFDAKSINVQGLTFGIVGCSTDYKGTAYIDNVQFSKVQVAEKYVEKTAIPNNTTPTKASISDLNCPSSVNLVDSNATASTASLAAYLKGVGKSDKVLYGHQNDTQNKAVLKSGEQGSTNSDTKDVTSTAGGFTDGTLPAVCGIDALSLTGAEMQLQQGDGFSSLPEKAAAMTKAAADEGAIITFSCHMPNFASVYEKGKTNGKYDYSGYTPNLLTGDVVSRVLPGGDLNEVFNGYLDLIAEYFSYLQKDDIPVLFRPFHENNGSWFWWGGSNCDGAAYRNMFRYTVEYLRDKKNIHNLLYEYSPNGPFTEEEYLSRYPGDEYIDLIGFDMYDNTVINTKDAWFTSFEKSLKVVEKIAKDHNKLSAVTETGIMGKQGCLDITGNQDLNWFQDICDVVAPSDLSYFMTWADFDTTNLFSPFMVSDTKGHEMINDFINFYNSDASVFANGVDNYKSLKVTTGKASVAGYITSPASGTRMTEDTTVKASIKNIDAEKIKFVLKDNEGKEVGTVDATDSNGEYTADITADMLNNIKPTLGTIELCADDKVLDSINIMFNMPEYTFGPERVDDFDAYYGMNDLLNKEWSTMAGEGCSVKPSLVSDKDKHNNGDYGVNFKYTISTAETSEGWAGMTKNINKDWSAYNALQLWIKPDGNGQKLVIQLTCDGEDFEVWLPEFAATKEAKLVTIPFSEFKGKNGGTFNAANIERAGLWCNTIVPSEDTGIWTVDSSMYFDDIKAVKSNATETIFESTEDGPVVVKGDVNDDGKINIKDYVKLQKYILNNDITINTDNADMNGDGKVNITDALLLKKILLD